jgi:hypothetical protein
LVRHPPCWKWMLSDCLARIDFGAFDAKASGSQSLSSPYPVPVEVGNDVHISSKTGRHIQKADQTRFTSKSTNWSRHCEMADLQATTTKIGSMTHKRVNPRVTCMSSC